MGFQEHCQLSRGSYIAHFRESCLLPCTLQMHWDILDGLKWSILLYHLGVFILSAKAGMVPTPSGTLGQGWRLLVLIGGKNKNEPIYLHLNFSIKFFFVSEGKKVQIRRKEKQKTRIRICATYAKSLHHCLLVSL